MKGHGYLNHMAEILGLYPIYFELNREEGGSALGGKYYYVTEYFTIPLLSEF